MKIAGAIIAGGRAERMGGADKPMLELAGRPLIAHLIERLAPQVDQLIINANGNPARFSSFGLEVFPDSPDRRAGPLAGLATVLGLLSRDNEFTHLLTAPVDCPFLPEDLASRLAEACTDETTVAIVRSNGREHPLTALWPVSLTAALDRHLATAQKLSVMAFLDTIEIRRVEFGNNAELDPFFNINTPEDLKVAALRLANTV